MLVTANTQHDRHGARMLWRLRALLGDPIPLAELARFCEQLATLIATGMLVSEAVSRAALACGPELQQIAQEIQGPLSRGASLYEALTPWKPRLPEIFLPVLEVGEVSGTLETSARRLAFAFERTDAVQQRFRYGVFDPKLVIALVALQGISTSLHASIADALLAAAMTFVELGALYIVGRMANRMLAQWSPFALTVDTLKLALPSLGTVLRNLAAARWARSFATLWNCGIPISSALEISAKSALNAHYERALRKAAFQTRQGVTLRDSLAGTELLPSYLLDMVGVGETSGNLGSSLEHFAGLLEDQAFTLATQQFAGTVVALKLLLVVAVFALMSH